MITKISKDSQGRRNKKSDNNFSAEIKRKAEATTASIAKYEMLCNKLKALTLRKKTANLSLNDAKKILRCLSKAHKVVKRRYQVFQKAFEKYPEAKSKEHVLINKRFSNELIRMDEALKMFKMFLDCF